jgi:hypothetical protein
MIEEGTKKPYSVLQFLASTGVGQYWPAGQKMLIVELTSAHLSAPPHESLACVIW